MPTNSTTKGLLNVIFFSKVAIPDVVDAAKDADILIFVVPHQFVRTICSTLLGKIKPTAAALSLIKVIFQFHSLQSFNNNCVVLIDYSH